MTIAPERKNLQRPETDLLLHPICNTGKNASDGPQIKCSFIFLVSSLLKNFLFSVSSGSVDGLPSLNDWAAAMSNLECKCPAVDGLPNHSGNLCPLSSASAKFAPDTKSRHISCIGCVCAMPANMKSTMERKNKIRATALCRRIFA